SPQSFDFLLIPASPIYARLSKMLASRYRLGVLDLAVLHRRIFLLEHLSLYWASDSLAHSKRIARVAGSPSSHFAQISTLERILRAFVSSAARPSGPIRAALFPANGMDYVDSDPGVLLCANR